MVGLLVMAALSAPFTAGAAPGLSADVPSIQWEATPGEPPADKASVTMKDIPTQMRGVYFNPLIEDSTNFPWLLFYPAYRGQIRSALQEMVDEARLNLAAIFLLMPHTLATPKQAPAPGQPLTEWANMAYLDNVAQFIDDCHDAGVSVALDMANNMWIPYSVDVGNRVVGVPDDPPGTDPWWPVTRDTPWEESVTWYTQIIEYVEQKANHPESIAWWCMGGNHALGGAETALWDNDGAPAMKTYNELFLRNVWPAFRAAGARPKAAPYLLPIFADNSHWAAREDARLSAFTNLRKWIVDDLGLPPDYWPITVYALCDPAPDGRFYLQEILDILGQENAHRIIATDLKGPGHEQDYQGTVLSVEGHSGPELLEWHFRKFEEYGIRHWWIWAYQDDPTTPWGLRCHDGAWKAGLIDVIAAQAPPPASKAPTAGVYGLGLLTAAATVGGCLRVRHR